MGSLSLQAAILAKNPVLLPYVAPASSSAADRKLGGIFHMHLPMSFVRISSKNIQQCGSRQTGTRWSSPHTRHRASQYSTRQHEKWPGCTVPAICSVDTLNIPKLTDVLHCKEEGTFFRAVCRSYSHHFPDFSRSQCCLSKTKELSITLSQEVRITMIMNNSCYQCLPLVSTSGINFVYRT